MKKLLLLLIFFTFNFLYASQKDASTLSEIVADDLYELNIQKIEKTINPYLKDKNYIQTCKITDLADNEVIFLYTHENKEKKSSNSLCSKDENYYYSDIKSDGVLIGKLELCTNKKSLKNPLNLTDEELLWIKEHPFITVHNEINWAPYNFYKDNKPQGLSIDYMNLLAKKIGISVKYVTGEWNDLFTKAINKKLDVMLNIAKNSKREDFLLFTDSYFKNRISIFSNKNSTHITDINSLYGKKVGVIEGFIQEDTLREKFPLVQRVLVKNAKEGLKLLRAKKIEAFIGSYLPIQNLIIKMKYDKFLEEKSEFFAGNDSILDLRIAVRNDYPTLFSIIKKAMANTSLEEINSIRKNWILYHNNSTKIDFTKEEREWIKRHPIINVGGERDWAPFDYVNSSGEYTGLANDYLKLITKLTNLKFKVHTNSNWNQLLDSLKDGTIDLLPSIYYSEERAKLFNFSLAYLTLSDYYITHKNYPKINSIESLYGKSVVGVKGYDIVSWLKKHHPAIDVIETDDILSALRKVESKEAVAFINDNPSSTYNIEKNFITNLKINNVVKNKPPISLHMAAKKDYEMLTQIINKAIHNISKEQRREILNQWMRSVDGKSKILELNQNEISWLSKKITLKFAVDPYWLPIEGINGDTKRYEGIISDYLERISEISGMNFKLVPTNSWSDSLKLMGENSIDLLPAISETAKRREFLNFTNTTIELSDGIVMRSDSKFISSIGDLEGLKVGVSSGTALHKMLESKYPKIKIVPQNGISKGIEQLSAKKIDAYIGNLEVISHIIFQKSLFNLKIVLKLDKKRSLKIGVNKNLPPEVISIINKSLGKISAEERNSIRKKWVGLKINEGLDYGVFYKIAIAIGVLIILFIYWNRKLSQMVDNKTQELKILLKSFNRNVIAAKTDLDGNITYVSDAFCKISAYKRDELLGKKLNLVKHPDVKDLFFKKLWERLLKEEVWRGEFLNRDKNGKDYWVYAIISPEYDTKDTLIGYSAILQDITAKKEVEKLSNSLEQKVQERTFELREQQQRFELTVAGSGDGLWDYDFSTKECWFSIRFKELLGFEDEEFENSLNNWKSRVHPEDLETTLKAFEVHILKNEPLDMIYRVRKKDESYIWVRTRAKSIRDSKNRAIKTSGSITDITELKNIEEEIAQNRLFLDRLLDSQEQIVITSDGLDLRSVNRRFLEFFQIDSLDDFKKEYQCICDKFIEDDSNNYLKKYIDGENWIDYILKNSHITHKVMMKKDNKNMIFSVSAAIMPVENGSIKSAVFTDITELEEQKKQTDLILSSLLQPILITSKSSRKIVYANSFAQEQYETDIETLIGLDIEVFYTYDGQREDILNELLNKGSVQNFETVFKTLKGREFAALLSLVDIVYNGEECMLGVANDITEQKNKEIEIQRLHKQTRESIEYASLIQHALIPSNILFKHYFSDYFTIWHPKDIVGGDIYLFEQLSEDEAILMVIDCTGHGVPGAFVTMLVKAIERQIVSKLKNSEELVSPAKILSIFNKSTKHLLKQESKDSISNAGFDGGIIYFNKKESILRFSGANTPLFYVKDKELKTIKGDRHSVGYKKSNRDYVFKEHELKVEEGMQFYLTTDGYLDQNGGKKGFPFGKKRFSKMIEDSCEYSFADQQEVFLYELMEYQDKEIRNDDITVIGFKI